MTTSAVERSAIRYAVQHGVLLVAAAGNDYRKGNPTEYPAALLQPVGSNGRGGVGLAVAASTRAGARAAFSSTGSWVSLAAPGESVFGAVVGKLVAEPAIRARRARARRALRVRERHVVRRPAGRGRGRARLGRRPSLTARQVAQILKDTASGHGVWTPELGFGVIDVAAAVARAAQLR